MTAMREVPPKPGQTGAAEPGFRCVAPSARPRVRVSDLTRVEIDDELIVYDERTFRCHRLGKVGAALFQACDGRRSCAELAADLKLSVAVVDALLAVFVADGLVLDASLSEAFSRRDFLETWARGVAAGVVASLLVPSAAQAVSCVSIGFPANGVPCCPGLVLVGGICLSFGG